MIDLENMQNAEKPENTQIVEKKEEPITLPKIEVNLQIDKERSIREQAKEIVDLAATKKAIEDEELVRDITDLKKEELKTGAESSLKEEVVRSKETERKLQEANYGVYQGIAELIGLKKPLPNWMLNTLMIIISPFLIIYYVLIGFVTGVINVTMDCVNSIVTKFADFATPAKKIIITVLIAGLVFAVLTIIYFFLHKYNIISF